MSVSVVVVRALLEAVERAHVDARTFLSAAHFDRGRLDQGNERIPQAEYDALVERALDLTGDPALGLRMGSGRALEWSLGAQVVLQAKSLRDGMQLAARYHRLHTDIPPFVVEEGASTSVMRVMGITGSLRCRRFSAEVAVAGIHKLVQHFVPRGRPEIVAFEHPSPPHYPEYSRLFQGKERFEQPFTGLVIDPQLMDARQLNPDDALHSMLRAAAGKRLAQLEYVVSYGDRVRECIAAVPLGRDMVSVASAIGLSPRSLRRRLLAEGVTFRDVVAQTLAGTAMRMLVDQRKTIQDVAHEMAFSEVSAFCRAFKRWTGSTPMEYQLQSGARGRPAVRPGV